MMEKGDRPYDTKPPDIKIIKSRFDVKKNEYLLTVEFYGDFEQLTEGENTGKWLCFCETQYVPFNKGERMANVKKEIKRRYQAFLVEIDKENTELNALGFRTAYFENGKWFTQ